MKLELSVRNTTAVIANIRARDAVLQRGMKRTVREWGLYTKHLTQFLSAYDTGFMRRNVRLYISPGGFAFEVGWDVIDFVSEGYAFYPFFVEFGTKYMAKQPALMPAYDDARPQFERAVRFNLYRSIERGF